MFGGDVGFAEAYMDGDWSSPDLTALIMLAARNTEALGDTVDGLGFVRRVHRVLHRLQANSRAGAKRNIEAHYDLGNDFYAAWLDPGMTYSSGLYRTPGQSLEQAQAAKQDRVMELLSLSGGESVLEIGCGWGGLAGADGAGRGGAGHGHYAVTIPAIACAGFVAGTRMPCWGLQDYRDVTERFDRIVSIEMLEAVGADYWPDYFNQLRTCLRPGGVAVLQVITIAEDRYEAYRRSADFIQRYVFPGGMLPSVPVLHDQIAQAGLVLQIVGAFRRKLCRHPARLE